MYWELWLSQVTASATLMPCMLIQDKGGQALCVIMNRLESCLAEEKNILMMMM